MEISISNLISYINSLASQGIFIAAKIIFIFFSLFFLSGILLSLFKSTWLKRIITWDLVEFLTYRPYGVKKVVKQWMKIMARLETGREDEYKLAIIEADSILDEVLARMGYSGETLGERLKKLSVTILPNIDHIWEVHGIRNNIVHDPDYRLSLDEARKFLSTYEKTLTDLQAF